ILHRHDKEPSVGKPSETRRLRVDDGNGLGVAVRADAQDLVTEDVGAPERVTSPAGTLREAEPVDQGVQRRDHLTSKTWWVAQHRTRVTVRRVDLDPIPQVSQDDPYPVYRELRDHHPVYYCEPRDLWVLSRYADVHRAVNDPATFSSAKGVVPSGFGADQPTIITSDPPAHTVLRKLVQRAFTPKRINALEPRIREIARQLVVALPERGEVDAFTQFSDLLPLYVMAELLGVDPDQRPMFKRCGDVIVSSSDTEALANAQRELTEYLAELFIARRAEPRQDLISVLLSASPEGDALPDDDLLGLCFLLLVAGTETTTR